VCGGGWVDFYSVSYCNIKGKCLVKMKRNCKYLVEDRWLTSLIEDDVEAKYNEWHGWLHVHCCVTQVAIATKIKTFN